MLKNKLSEEKRENPMGKTSPINLGTPITTLASGASSLELVNIGGVVVVGDIYHHTHSFWSIWPS